MQIDAAVTAYLDAKDFVIAAGYEAELAWQEGADPGRISESAFLAEAAWVILASGFRESTVRAVFPAVSRAFLNWQSAAAIVKRASTCRQRALRHLRNPRKIDAIISLCRTLKTVGLASIMERLKESGPDHLLSFPMFGPATSRHLVKNLGFPVAKPDRHLRRLASRFGCTEPQEMCAEVAEYVGAPIGVVDLVFWRWITLRQASGPSV